MTLLANSAKATLTYWDPQSNNAANPYLGDMSGSWEGLSWSTSNAGQASPQAWVDSTAALFGVHTGGGTPPFVVSMNANHNCAGMFDGSVTPNGVCTVTITGTGVLNLVAGLDAFDVASGGYLTVSNVLSGPGEFTAEGSGQIFLCGTNTYTGGTLLGYSGASFTGVLNLGSPHCFGTGSITVTNGNGAALVYGTNLPPNGALTITNAWSFSPSITNTPNINIVGTPAGLTFSGPWNLSSVTPDIGSGNVETNVVIISGVISGTGGLKKDHTGNLILSATNTYTGTTTVTNGLLQLGDGTSRNGSVAGTITVTSPGTLIYANPLPQTYSKVISGTGAFIKQAGGLLTLAAANTYSGSTTITNGSTLQIGVANALPSGTGKGDVMLLGTLDLNGFACAIDGLDGTGIVDTVTSAGTSTLTEGNNNVDATFTGVIQNTSGTTALTKTGTGTLNLGGINTYSGVTTITAGSVQLGANNAVSAPSPVVVNTNASLDMNSSFGGTIAALSGPGAVNNLFQTLNVAGNAATGSLTQNFNGFSCLFGSINGAGTVTKSGTHAMAFRAPILQFFSGGFTFNGGTLSVGDAPNLLPTTLHLNVPAGALFQLDANSQTLGSLTGGGAVNLGGGALTVGSGTFNGVIQNSELPGSSTALGNGLRGYYYTNIDFTGLGLVSDDSTVNLTNMSALPFYSPTAKTNQISIRWLGQVLTTTAGNYTFTTIEDDGARLWVNGVMLVNDWAPHGPTAKSGTISLAGNTRCDIVLEYFNNTAGGEITLAWTPPGDSSVLIPSSNLYLPGPGSLNVNGGLIVTSPNTYTGGSTVNAGTLEAGSGALGRGNVNVNDAANNNAALQLDSSTAINPAADLLIGGFNPIARLNFSGTNLIHALSFDGGNTYAVSGVWGPAGSGAPHQNAALTGTGFLKVTANASVNTLTASASTAVYGSSVTFTSTITGSVGTPSGSVTFYDGANLLGTTPLVSGAAVLSVSNLLVDFSPHGVLAVYSGDANYASSSNNPPVFVTTTAATITPIVVVSNKVYDTTTTATNLSVTFGGIYPGDVNYVHIAGSYSSTFTDPYVGTNKTVNVSGLSLTGSLSDNYTLSTNAVTTTASITSKPVFVTGLTATNKVYDSTTTDGVTGIAALSGVLAADTNNVSLSGTAAAAFTTKNSGTNKPVTLTGFTLVPVSGVATNYTLTLTNLSANITNFTVTVTNVTANGKVYDGTTLTTLSGTPALTPPAFAGDVVSISGPPTANFTNANAGLRGVTVTGYTLTNTDAANYTLKQPTGLSATITMVGTTATIASSLNPSSPGTNVTFTYIVTAVSGTSTSPTGSATFITNGFPVAPTVTLVANGAGSAKATYSTALLPLGTNTVAVQYLGDANYSGPVNVSLQQVVQNGVCSQTNALLGIVYNGGNSYTLNFQGTPSATYYVLSQTNAGLPLTDWIPVPGSTNSAASVSGLWSVTVTNPAPSFFLSKALQPCP
jgi:fibronectin-binding autotransporter adhesin